MDGAIFRIDGATGVRIDKRAIGLRDQTSDRIRRLCGFRIGGWRGFLRTRVVGAFSRIIGGIAGIACAVGISVRIGLIRTINRLVRAHLLP